MRVLFNNTLAIDRAQPEDGGNYVCRGSNGYSEAQDSVNIVVEDLQVIRENIKTVKMSNIELSRSKMTVLTIPTLQTASRSSRQSIVPTNTTLRCAADLAH